MLLLLCYTIMKYMQQCNEVPIAVTVFIGFLLHTVTSSYVDIGQTPIQLSVVSSCGNSSTLSWSSSKNQELRMCELTLYKTGQLDAKIIDIFPDSENHYIHLHDLHVGQSYSAFLACDRTKKTNNVEFIFGQVCDANNLHNNHNETSNTADQNADVRVFKMDKFSTVDWLSAIIFSCVGIILIIVVVYFIWKKYQHRQRILQIFRHEQNDPFQALYSPTQDSYSF